MFPPTDMVYKVATGMLAGIATMLLLALWLQTSKLDSKEQELNSKILENTVITSEKESLAREIHTQNEAISKLKVNLENKTVVYKDRVKAITKNIEIERIVLRDLNESEDCKNMRRLTNEILDITSTGN